MVSGRGRPWLTARPSTTVATANWLAVVAAASQRCRGSLQCARRRWKPAELQEGREGAEIGAGEPTVHPAVGLDEVELLAQVVGARFRQRHQGAARVAVPVTCWSLRLPGATSAWYASGGLHIVTVDGERADGVAGAMMPATVVFPSWPTPFSVPFSPTKVLPPVCTPLKDTTPPVTVRSEPSSTPVAVMRLLPPRLFSAVFCRVPFSRKVPPGPRRWSACSRRPVPARLRAPPRR